MTNWQRFYGRLIGPVDRPPVTVEHTVVRAEAPADVMRRTWLAEALKPAARRDPDLMDACLDDWLKLHQTPAVGIRYAEGGAR